MRNGGVNRMGDLRHLGSQLAMRDLFEVSSHFQALSCDVIFLSAGPTPNQIGILKRP